MNKKIEFKNTNDETLVGIFSTGNDNFKSPLAVLLHGFSSNKDSVTTQYMSELLNEKGLATFRFDFSGRGESEGYIENSTLSKGVGEVSAAMTLMVQLESVDPNRVVFFGTSYGGNVALLYAAQNSYIRAIALKAPVSDYVLSRALQLGADGIDKWRKTGKTVLPYGTVSNFSFYEDAQKIDTYAEAAKITCPVLIVQGDKDDTVPLEHSQRLAASIKSPNRFEVIAGADHAFSNSEHLKELCQISTQFLVKSLSLG